MAAPLAAARVPIEAPPAAPAPPQAAPEAEAAPSEQQLDMEIDFEIEHQLDDAQTATQPQSHAHAHAQSPPSPSASTRPSTRQAAPHAAAEDSKDSPPPTALAPQHTRRQAPLQPQRFLAQASLSSGSDSADAFHLSHLHAAAHHAIDSDNEEMLAQFLCLLEAHREECERKSMYVEAGLAKKKIEELRRHEDRRRRKALSVRHLSEKLDLESAYLLEHDAWTAESQTSLQQFERETQARQQEMMLCHVDELERWTVEQQEQRMMRPKWSTELLRLRALQESHARTRDYDSAERIKQHADRMEQLELHSLRSSWSARIEGARRKFLRTQQAEMHAFLNRRAEDKAKLEARRMHELQGGILQKYANLRAELERAQAKEAAKLARMGELGVSASPLLREQAPKNRTHPRATTPYLSAAALTAPNGTYSGSPRSPARSPGAALLRTQAVSRGWRQSQQQADVWRAEDVPTPSHHAEVPTIALALNGRGSARAPFPPTAPLSARSATPTGVAHTGPSRQMLLQQRRKDSGAQTARPATSQSYVSSGRAPPLSPPRSFHSLSPARHYSRPPTRAGTALDRQTELRAILAGRAASPTAAAASASHGPTPPKLSYLDRMVSRRSVAQKVARREGGAPQPVQSAAYLRARRAQQQSMDQRRIQAILAEQRASKRSLSSEDEFEP